MRLFFVRFTLGVVALLSITCGSHTGLEISSTKFDKTIATQQNLTFVFNERVVQDSLVGEWDTTQYLKFTPPVAGKFRWVTPNELIFSPFHQFAPSTNYKAEVTPAVLGKGSDKKNLGENLVSEFHTEYLKPDGSESYWTRSAQGGAELRVTLKFNYPVSSQRVGELLHLRLNNRDIPYQVAVVGVSPEVQLAIIQIADDFDEATMQATVDAGLQCAESNWQSDKAFSFDIKLPSRKVLRITDVNTDFSEGVGVVRFVTSQPIEQSDLKSFISFEPSVNFTVEREDFGFSVKGDFKAENAYSCKIKSGLRGTLGGSMNDEYQTSIKFGELEPSIGFTSNKAMYLSPKSSRNIGIKIVNTPRVKITIAKIFENNILHFLRRTKRYYWEDEEGGVSKGGYDGNYDLSRSEYEDYGNIVMEKEYDTRTLPMNGNIHLLNFSLDDMSDFKGVYVMKVESSEEQWTQAAKMIAVSDIGMIAKSSANSVWVFCNSIKDATPVSGVQLKFISTNNQTIGTATSDASGVAVFDNIKTKAADFRVGMISARYAQDFTFLSFNETEVDNSRFDVGGLQENSADMMAYIYGDRDIYRPGETIHFNTILRTGKWETPSKVPVKIKILAPDGKDFRIFKKSLNENGAIDTDVPLSPTVVTGTYAVEVYSANDVLLGSKTLSIEEFMPDRIKLNLSMNKENYSLKDSVKAMLNAVNYFGPPAADRNYEVEFALVRKQFYSTNYPDYIFSIKTKNTSEIERVTRQGKTDAKGDASESFPLPEELLNTGMLNAKVYATVFDETGRPVRRMKQFDLPTQDVFFGIKAFNEYISTRQEISVPLIAVDRNGKAVNSSQAKVQLVKYNWRTVLERSGDSYFRYISQREEVVVSEKVMNIGGTNGASFTINAQQSGEYEVRIMKPDAGTYVARSLWAYGWGNTDASSFEVKKEGEIAIEFDKEQYNVGETAKVLFKTPFAGRMLITTERNGVYNYQYVNTDQKSAMIQLPVTDDYLPNVYICATLFKPLDDGSMPLTVAHGCKPLIVQRNDSRIQLAIDAPGSVRSNSRQTVKVRAQNNSNVEMTIAVVDEGILAIKNTKTPDPFNFFYQRRALQTSSYDVYPYIYPDLKPGKYAFGGGDDQYNNRLTPVLAKRVNLVAFWSGIVKTNGSGEGFFTIDIPQFSGSLRIMAVAYKGRSFGSAEKNMTVADPVVLSTGLPRFMSPGDTVLVPVTMSNTTTKSTTATASINSDGVVKVVGNNSQSATIAPNSEQRVNFRVVAAAAIGTANIEIKVNAGGESYSDKTEIAVRPATSLLKTDGSGVLAAGETKEVSLQAPYIPSTMKAKLIVSRSPAVEIAKSMSYLIHYPHGCVEQTTSAAFPQLYVADISKGLSNSEQRNSQYYVQEAINKLMSMQLYNGGLSYWQGGIEESWWGSAYAAHFLLEAKKAGYDVPQAGLDKLVQYLAKKVHFKDKRTYYYWVNNVRKERAVAPQEIFYSLFVMSLAGKQDVALMNYYKTALPTLTEDSRYMLACAYLYLGDKNSFEQILPSKFSESSVPQLGGSFGSWLRDEALALSILVDVDYNNPQVNWMARHLSQQVKSKRYLSTQECSFALMALGKIARKIGDSKATASISVGGKQIGSANGKDAIISEGIAGQKVTISATGGAMYYFWEVSGISNNNDYVQEDNMLRIRRTYLDRRGNPINGNTFKQNDLIVVKLAVVSTTGAPLENVAITDLLPAGFEIENPRITEVPDYAWVKNASTPQFLDIRDDRINMFATVGGTESYYYYVVRAVSPGTYRVGPASADAMYNGEYHSYNGGGVVKVIQ